MSFPSDHRYPGELPPFFATGHNFEHIGVAEDVAFERGEDRGRQIYTFNPQLVSVATELTQLQFDRFHTWHEQDLQAGASQFDVLVAEQGGTGVSWWTSQFVGTYKWEAYGWYYVVSAQLLLLDGPYATRVAPGLRASTPAYHSVVAISVFDGELRASTPASASVQAIVSPPALYANTPASAGVLAILPEAGVEELARVWMGLDYTQASVASSDDALTAQLMGL